jgi:hypothetical protein
MTLFKPAQRTQAKLRLAIDGPSGSGKTYSALLIAKGLAGGDLAKVAVIDTERGSGSLYSDLGPYCILDFGPPYSVDRYVKAIATAAEEGFEVIVVDSLTHAWSGEGGVLDHVDAVAKAQTHGNSFAAWKSGTPLQKKLIDSLLSSPCHVIATMRSKSEYVIEENERGKKAPRKIGLAPDQRKDLEFEFTLVLDLSREHIATASKDRTGLFDDRLEVPSEKMGAELAAWLGSAAAAPAEKPSRTAQHDQQVEQAAATPPKSGNGNGRINSAAQARLASLIEQAGRDIGSILLAAEKKGIGGGTLDSLTMEDSTKIAAAMKALINEPPEDDGPKDDAPDGSPPDDYEPSAHDLAGDDAHEPQEAASAAPAAAETAATPQADDVAGGASGDGFEEFDAVLSAAAEKKRAEEYANAEKPGRKATVTAPQLTRLGALAASLEAKGVGEAEWRAYLFAEEGVRSRAQLTKAAATRMVDKLNRWSVDLQTGVRAPGEARTP